METDSIISTGRTLFNDGHFQKALECYTEAYSLDTTSITALSNAALCAIRLCEYEQAVHYASIAVAKNPIHIKARSTMGAALLELRKPKEAQRCFEEKQLWSRRIQECVSLRAKLAFEEAIRVSTLCLKDRLSLERLGGVDHSFEITIDWVKSLVSLLMREKTVPIGMLLRILVDAYGIFSNSPTCVFLDLPSSDFDALTVCGDVHGQFDEGLLAILAKFGFPSATHFLLFNGDFVDRGPRSLAVLTVLLALKIAAPAHIFLNRGNHEAAQPNRVYGFAKELATLYPHHHDDLFGLVQQVFSALPLAHVVQSCAFICHGGIAPRSNGPPPSLAEICALDRANVGTDPQTDVGIKPSSRGTSVTFGPDVTAAFLARNNLSYLIRSHEYCEQGFRVDHNGQCITIFSSPRYMGASNPGAVVRFRPQGPAMLCKPEFVTF